jgi:hypothetical protein
LQNGLVVIGTMIMMSGEGETDENISGVSF